MQKSINSKLIFSGLLMLFFALVLLSGASQAKAFSYGQDYLNNQRQQIGYKTATKFNPAKNDLKNNKKQQIKKSKKAKRKLAKNIYAYDLKFEKQRNKLQQIK